MASNHSYRFSYKCQDHNLSLCEFVHNSNINIKDRKNKYHTEKWPSHKALIFEVWCFSSSAFTLSFKVFMKNGRDLGLEGCWAISWLNSTTLVLHKHNHFYLSIWFPRIKKFKDILSLNTEAYLYSSMSWVLWIILKCKMIPFQGTYLIGKPGHTFKQLSLIISDGSQREEQGKQELNPIVFFGILHSTWYMVYKTACWTREVQITEHWAGR